MPGASLMMRFFGSPPRESRSASGPGTEADYQQGGGEEGYTVIIRSPLWTIFISTKFSISAFSRVCD